MTSLLSFSDFFFVCTFGPLAIGIVMDSFGSWARWWRWWYAPLGAGIPGSILCVVTAIVGGDWGDLSLGGALFFMSLFFVLVPVVLSASVAGLLRWADRAAAKGP